VTQQKGNRKKRKKQIENYLAKGEGGIKNSEFSEF